jgi:hypothetical protein
LRFIPETPTTKKIAAAVMAQMNAWFQQAQDNPGDDIWIKYWTIEPTEGGTIAAKCEFIGEPGVIRLAEHIASKFPQYRRVVLGDRITGLPRDGKLTWEEIPKTDSLIDGKKMQVGPFRISRQYVTIEQYFEFMDSTGFVPECEKTGACKFRGYQIASEGKKAGQWPVTHVGLNDAVAFTEWMGGRLPDEAELYTFFECQHARKWEINFGNESWTATRDKNGNAIALCSPYINQQVPPIHQLRRAFPPNNWDYPFISFRVLKNMK